MTDIESQPLVHRSLGHTARRVEHWSYMARLYAIGFWLCVLLSGLCAWLIVLQDTPWPAIPAVALIPVAWWQDRMHDDARMSRDYWRNQS